MVSQTGLRAVPWGVGESWADESWADGRVMGGWASHGRKGESWTEGRVMGGWASHGRKGGYRFLALFLPEARLGCLSPTGASVLKRLL